MRSNKEQNTIFQILLFPRNIFYHEFDSDSENTSK